MKKTGFTISELMITLTIIGVVSALMSPALSNIVPDKNRVKLLQYRTLLSNTLSEIMNDEDIYHPHRVARMINGVGTDVLVKDDGTQCSGIYCVEGNLTTLINERLVNNLGDNSEWTITESNNVYKIQIRMDKNKPNKLYKTTDTKRINSYILKFNDSGYVVAGDPLTDAFISNPHNTNNKKEDLATAKKFANTRKY